MVFVARWGIEIERGTFNFYLNQSVRDEAHRFAFTGQRNRRDKARVTSSLEGITGIGPEWRQKLLARFGRPQGARGARVDDLLTVDGISQELAEQIYAQMR